MTEEVQETYNLNGKYEAQSGRRFQYYGFCSDWVPHGKSPWTIWLYDESKVFKYDDVRTSKDMLTQFDSFGLNMRMGRELTLGLARSAAEQKIEEWDRANPPR